MFMQIGIKDENQNALCFLWHTKNGFKQYQYTRLIFGAKCSPSIAIFALHQTAADCCVTKPIIAQLLHKSFYMDDFVHSFNPTLEARDSTTQLKSSLRQGDSTQLSSYLTLMTRINPLMEAKFLLMLQCIVSWWSNGTQLTIRYSCNQQLS